MSMPLFAFELVCDGGWVVVRGVALAATLLLATFLGSPRPLQPTAIVLSAFRDWRSVLDGDELPRSDLRTTLLLLFVAAAPPKWLGALFLPAERNQLLWAVVKAGACLYLLARWVPVALGLGDFLPTGLFPFAVWTALARGLDITAVWNVLLAYRIVHLPVDAFLSHGFHQAIVIAMTPSIILVVYAWCIVYCQLLLVLLHPFSPPPLHLSLHAQSLRHLKQEIRRQELAASLATPRTSVDTPVYSFSTTLEEWRATRHLGNTVASQAAMYLSQCYQKKDADPPFPILHDPRLAAKPGYGRLLRTLEFALDKANPSYAEDWEPLQLARYLAGVFVQYLLPLPSLRYLVRPLNRELVGRILILYPFHLVLRTPWQARLETTSYTPPPSLVDSPVVHLLNSFVPLNNLGPLLKETTSGFFVSANPKPVLYQLLLLDQAEEETLKAEERLHDEILEAVLEWKRRKQGY